ncbi:N-acetyltransferase [Rhizobium sp. CNPSo 4039]|uniref:GNAT family N-acetyltransferase n=1 Tax=Rhizobium sp. CNPSo 4039 TaxID=3021409 RepID=UPI00254DE686|nr:N-acetyltransferase [Rhizobium sp. CNPSo 4039]MDK4717687.1 N-acetyltransferase [Rhizobium sp. CNPSo 4039]
MSGAVVGQLPEFPARAGHHRLDVPACMLRSARLDDIPFLRQLYRSFRENELALMPWSPEVKEAFLDQQFNLQHRYYIATFPQTDFLIIEKDGISIGRLYLNVRTDIWHIIDIGFLPEWRGLGLGTATLKTIQDATAASKSSGITLHVDRNNRRAYQLYQVLGFKAVDATDTHIGMEWSRHQLPSDPRDSSSCIN